MKRLVLLLVAAASFAGIGPALATNNPPNNPSQPIVYLPDLTISQVQPYYTYKMIGPYLIRVVVPDKLWVQVTNQGNAPTPANFGMMFEWDFGYLNEIEYFWFAYSLPAGQSAWVEADANGYNLWASGHQFRLYIDYTGSVKESNESNNVYDGP